MSTDDQSAQDLAKQIEALRDRQDEQEQTIERLRKEKRELEQEVEQVQQGLSIPKPNRRQLLKAGGTGMAALLFGSAASGNAAAATGTIGSDSQRYDWYADAIDSKSIDTESATIGSRPIRAPLTSSSSVTTHASQLQSIASNSAEIIFDINNAVVLYGGTVVGEQPDIRLTIDGTLVIEEGTVSPLGEDSNGDTIGAFAVPPAVAESSMKLEAFNNKGASSAVYGWDVKTETWTP